jgi:hypothetical protein
VIAFDNIIIGCIMLITLLLSCILTTAFAANVTWFNSNLTITASDLGGIGPWTFDVLVLANREIDRSDGGHFKINVTGISLKYGKFYALSPCIEIGTAAANVLSMIGGSEAAFNDQKALTLVTILDLSVKRYGNGKLPSNFTTRYNMKFSGNDVQSLAVAMTQEDCSPMESFGQWNDGTNWAGGSVPSSTDDVYFSPNSGRVLLSNDVTVNKITIDGGLFISHDTGCPDKWSVGPAHSSLG